jgi:hypothetical protein
MPRRTLLLVGTVLSLAMLLVPMAATATPAPPSPSVSGDPTETRTLGGYRTYDEVVAELRMLANTHPNIVALMDLGALYPNGDGSPKTTWDGHQIWGVKVSDYPNINETDEPDLLYTGAHHAREWITIEVVMYALNRIVSQYGTNGSITSLVNTRELWFVPIVNPDGFIYTQEQQWGTVEPNSMWRKNRRDNGDGTFGVDLNRNYGFDWGYDNQGSSPQTNSDIYRGPAPFSEPETQMIRDLGTAVNFSGMITFHSFAEVIFFPWGHKSEHAPKYLLMKELGRRMAYYNGYEYGDLRDGLMYAVNGDTTEWFYGNWSSLSFTFEVGTDIFIPAESLILPICMENYEPCIVLARYAPVPYTMFQSGIAGVVQDPRGNPLEGASVHAQLLGADALDFTTLADGAFSFRAPREASYSVTAAKDGYSTEDQSYSPMWADRLTSVNITIRDNVPPAIARVEASLRGEAGTSFGIGQDVRIDLFERDNEAGLQGTVTIQSIEGQYFNRKKPVTWDPRTRSYYYVWNTSGLKPRSDYIVTTELWDIDNNKDPDGVLAGQPDLTLTLRDITPPMTPRDLLVTIPPEGGRILVGWTANSDDTEVYTLSRRVGAAGEWAFLINLTKADSQFIDQGLDNGQRYEYRVMAWDRVPLPSGWSAMASGVPTDTVPPGLVTGLIVTAPSEGGELDLSWQESTDDTATYALVRDSGDGFVEVARLPRGTTSYRDMGLVNEKQYLYKVRALDLSLNQGPLTEASIGMPRDVVPPAMPTVDPLPELTNALELRVSGGGEPGTVVDVHVNGQVVTGATGLLVGDDGNWSGTVTMVPKENRVRLRARDTSGNPSGLTPEYLVYVDISLPTVDYQYPVPGQLAVEVQLVVEVKVSEALVPSTVAARIVYADSGGLVPSSFTYDDQAHTVKVYPASPLDRGAAYQVIVEGTDKAGNALTGGTFSFTTVEPKPTSSPISAGLVIGAVALIAIVVVVAFLLLRRRRAAPAAGRPDAVTASYAGAAPPSQQGGDGGAEAPAPRQQPGEPGRDWEEY